MSSSAPSRCRRERNWFLFPRCQRISARLQGSALQLLDPDQRARRQLACIFRRIERFHADKVTIVCVMSESSLNSVAAEVRMRSPRIMDVAWGKIEVEGVGIFRDAKLFPGGAREWDWRETGTEHVPGIQPADVRELLDRGATTIVLSEGMLKRLRICPETLKLLEQQGVAVHVLPTQDAVDLYNDLSKTERVAGLFHTTC